MEPKAVLERAMGWVRRHPEQVVDSIKEAVGLRVSVPLDVLRFFVSQIKGKKAPRDVEIAAVPPGLRLSATVRAMKTTLRVSAIVLVDSVRIGPDEFRLEVRLRDIAIAIIGATDTPLAALIQSGSLDLRHPGKLVGMLPQRPAYLVEADDDRFVLDLMRDPKLGARLRRPLSLVTPIVSISGIRSKGDALGLQLSCLPAGLAAAIVTVRSAL
jgi:hypothetical protein